ncbi:MAG: hypothetical protein GXP54_04220 [Deltaproteobacteria bacterium]|nr:hypothetical protein [Deltaproteobacteria bacterium]
MKNRRILAALTFVAAAAVPVAATADIANFDLAGRLYTKWLYRNNDSQGVLTYGNPFWPDDIAGDNGVGTEFELKVFGKVSRYVDAYARIQSRFGEMWQDWWESGERKYGGELNTSGDSVGLNRASYIKLRGTWVRATIPFMEGWTNTVTIGSSDLGMFNPWSIGKVRYIDRDNGKGIFIHGLVGDGIFSYDLAMIALPKLYVGPWWSTGIGDPSLTRPFFSQDWAYGAKLTVAPDWGTFTLVTTYTNDIEVDMTDPDAVGSLYGACTDDLGNPIAGCEKDHAVDYFSRYQNLVATLESQIEPLDWLSVNTLFGYSMGRIDPRLTANGVALNQGVSPVVYKDTDSYAVRARVEFADPFDVGLSFKVEYFNIGEDWNSIFGARREADVLLTDGLVEGVQLPTLNLANEFIDFDEDFVESCIGWHGGTVMALYARDALDVDIEGTYIYYNTNSQNRDVDQTYPDFLHSDGFTDTDLYDYANTTDRGRDPRSVYRRNQDRRTVIAVLNLRYIFDALEGIELSGKGKFIWDRDYRSHTTVDDDYDGRIWMGRVKLGIGVVEGLKIELGGQFDWWDEANRKGTLEQGYGDDRTWKAKAFGGLTFNYEGLKFHYRLEYLHKDQARERDVNQVWKVFRSKASLEVNW